MTQFETLTAYLSRVLTLDALFFFAFLFAVSGLLRKPAAKWLGVSVARYLFIAASFSAVVALSIRYWDANGTAEQFWLFDAALWSSLKIGANWVLNFALYVPSSLLLTFAGKKLWNVVIFMIAFSFFIETIQQYTTFGVGDPADFTSNALGAIVGALIGFFMIHIMRKRESRKSELA